MQSEYCVYRTANEFPFRCMILRIDWDSFTNTWLEALFSTCLNHMIPLLCCT